jgi:hypothetical protein
MLHLRGLAVEASCSGELPVFATFLGFKRLGVMGNDAVMDIPARHEARQIDLGNFLEEPEIRPG